MDSFPLSLTHENFSHKTNELRYNISSLIYFFPHFLFLFFKHRLLLLLLPSFQPVFILLILYIVGSRTARRNVVLRSSFSIIYHLLLLLTFNSIHTIQLISIYFIEQMTITIMTMTLTMMIFGDEGCTNNDNNNNLYV